MVQVQEKISSIGWFLYDEEAKMVCLHKRDKKGGNKWDHFGGRVENNKETEYEAFLRELCEELGITIKKNKVKELSRSRNKIMYYVPFSIKKIREIRIGEGTGFAWFDLSDAFKLKNLDGVASKQLKILKEKFS